MYLVYIDELLLPIAPEKIVTQRENDNREIELIDGSFVIRTGGAGLRRIKFDILLPMSKYPFANYEDGFKDGTYYIDKLEKILRENKPVWLDIYRSLSTENRTFLTSVRVVPEKIVVTEDANNGLDIKVKAEFVEYRNVETKVSEEKQQRGYVERESDFSPPEVYVVESGDSLWQISKMFFDDPYRYSYLAQINSIKPPYTIYKGQVIKLRE